MTSAARRPAYADMADGAPTSTVAEIPNLAASARWVAINRGGIDRDVVVLNARRIKFERCDIFPAGGDRAVAEGKRRQVSWTNQPAVFDATLRQIRLLVRAGALKGVDGVTEARQHQRMAFEHDAKNGAVWEHVAPGDGDEARLMGRGGRVQFCFL